MVKSAVSCFYGAIVESAYSEVGLTVSKFETNLNAATKCVYQTITYLKHLNTSAIQKFIQE